MTMDSVTEYLLFAITFLTSMVIYRLLRKSRKPLMYPPSLPSLPLIGSLPFLRDFDRLPEFFLEKSYEFGPVFTFRIGMKTFLVLNNRESIDDALIRHSSSFSGRDAIYFEKCFNPKCKGIAFANYNSDFKRYHKLSLSILRDFGFGSKSLMETRILTEATELIKILKEINGQPFDPKKLVELHVSSVLVNILFGHRNTSADGISEASYQVKRYIESMNPAISIFPVLRFLPGYREIFLKAVDSFAKSVDAIEVEIENALKDGSPDNFVRSYIEREGKDYDHEQLVHTLKELIAASTDTTTTALLWAFILLANHPTVQQLMQLEIDSVVPRDRLPTMHDQPHLPYVEAVMHEVLRMRPSIPSAVPHITLHDTEVLDYSVPADTVVIPNLWAASMNRGDWTEPEAFKPERFLDVDNKLFETNRMMSFSRSRRSCLGEALARQQMTLFMSALLQNFSILPAEGAEKISVERNYSMVLSMSPFTIRMVARSQ